MPSVHFEYHSYKYSPTATMLSYGIGLLWPVGFFMLMFGMRGVNLSLIVVAIVILIVAGLLQFAAKSFLDDMARAELMERIKSDPQFAVQFIKENPSMGPAVMDLNPKAREVARANMRAANQAVQKARQDNGGKDDNKQ